MGLRENHACPGAGPRLHGGPLNGPWQLLNEQIRPPAYLASYLAIQGPAMHADGLMQIANQTFAGSPAQFHETELPQLLISFILLAPLAFLHESVLPPRHVPLATHFPTN